MTTEETPWYKLKDIDQIDTPALVVYKERVKSNIQLAIEMAGDVDRLQPHVKTHKSPDATQMLMAEGIYKFKCATIAEAEMLGMAGAKKVLLAYQPGGPKIARFIALASKFKGTNFSCLVDNLASVEAISKAAEERGMLIGVYIDLNVGMNRTGIIPGDGAIQLYERTLSLKGLKLLGLHLYDGHIKNPEREDRKNACDEAFHKVEEMIDAILKKGHEYPEVIAGGSTTFPVHAKRERIICSPGTFIYWDKGYGTALKEQNFKPAALVITRIVSLPSSNKICLDLGHKSIASENELYKRVHFLDAPDLQFVSQSEEHLVLAAAKDHHYKVGDVFYGIPYHICPTCALYESALVSENQQIVDEWPILARNRKISI